MQSFDLLSEVPALPVLSDLTKPSFWQINSAGQASARKFLAEVFYASRSFSLTTEKSPDFSINHQRSNASFSLSKKLFFS